MLIVALAGCTADVSGSDAQAQGLHEGLNVLSTNVKKGVSLAYVKSGHIIYLQTRIGQLKPKQYREKFPNEPQHETDMRVQDAQGRTFILVRGGDRFIDPSWAKDLAKTKQITTKAQGLERQQDFALAAQATKAFAKVAQPKLVRQVGLMKMITKKIPTKSTLLQSRAKLVKKMLPKMSAERMYGENGCNYNLQEGDLYWKSFALIANHSAVIGWNYNGCTGTWDQELVACNHGTCANSSNMTYSCYSLSDNWSVWNTNSLYDYYSYEWYNDSNYVTGACQTHYGIDVADITVYGGGDPNHVCNDDSAFELDEIRYQRRDGSNWSGNGYTCHFYSHWYGPLDSDGWAPNCP